MTSIAIIGAGLGGLSAAHILEAHGARVTLFDKGHFPGGRLATRRSRDSATTYDHGAQYFTVKHPSFAQFTAHLQESGVIAPWKGHIMSIEAPGTFKETNSEVTRYVGTPYMNAIAEHLASDLTIHKLTRVDRITRTDSAFSLTDQDTHLGDFDAVLLNTPPPQAVEILEEIGVPDLLEACRAHTMQPCWAVMLTLEREVSKFDGAFVNIEDSPLSWIAKDTSKPGRTSMSEEAWVLHATHTWSDAHIEASREQVARALHNEFIRLVELDVRAPASLQAHRWRYAIPKDKDEDTGALIAAEAPVSICGDWLRGGRVEGAFLSGIAGAHELVRRLDLSPVRELATWQQPLPEV